MSASADKNYVFWRWLGDVPFPQRHLSSIVLTMDRPRSIQPVFIGETPGGGPRWWYARGVINDQAETDDYAAVNQGQLKWIATQAHAEMEATLTGGAGSTLTTIVSGLPTNGNYAVVNIGQVKALAAPFYDRLGLPYPWSDSPNTNDFGAANVGQVKNVFSFPVSD